MVRIVVIILLIQECFFSAETFFTTFVKNNTLNFVGKYKQSVIRFKRWTNKGWGIFISLRAVVHILNVKHGICRQAVLKQTGILKRFSIKNSLSERVLSMLIHQKDDTWLEDLSVYLNLMLISESRLQEEICFEEQASSEGSIYPVGHNL